MAEITVAGGTRVGFSANKTLEEAKSLKDNRLVICKGHELSFNGQRVGLSESEASFIKEKMDEEFKARIGVKLVVSPTVQDAAAPVSVTVTVKTTFNGAAVDADALPTCTASNSGGSNPITLTKSSTGVYTGKTISGVSRAETFTVKATVRGVQKTETAVVQAYHKIWYGVSSQEVIAASGPIPSSFTSVGPKSSAAGDYSFTFTANTYGFILVPNGVSLPASMQGDNPSGVEGPLPVPFTKLANVVVGGVTYTQLRIASMQAASTHKVTFK